MFAVALNYDNFRSFSGALYAGKAWHATGATAAIKRPGWGSFLEVQLGFMCFDTLLALGGHPRHQYHHFRVDRWIGLLFTGTWGGLDYF